VVYEFAGFALDLDRFELRRDGEVCHLEPRAFDVLTHLVRAHDRVVPKEELLDAVWGDRFVSESALTTRIKALRKALGDDGQEQRVIRTVRGRGYQLAAPVRIVDGDGIATPETTAGTEATRSAPTQEIRFCRTADGTRLAYALVGEGPPLVKAANWMTHLDYDWESPVWSHWLRGLARHRQLVRYDQRGCGLSDWDVDGFSSEAWLADLETVVDEVGADRFPLLGLSRGASTSIAYAVAHPERVTHLVLWGASTQGRMLRARTDDERRAAEVMVELARLGWGADDPAFRQVFAMQFIPDGTAEDWAHFNELHRRTTSPENAARFMEAFGHADVTDLAPQVTVPTLILHGRGDMRVPFESARELASLIPGSRLVPLDSRNHILRADEPAWPRFLAELDAFLGDAAPS
jgi:DNA-binding winged helix-turn-helix (wHTH) protein/pimeloyl-ACP methyl ester carboxylesterase